MQFSRLGNLGANWHNNELIAVTSIHFQIKAVNMLNKFEKKK